MEVHEAIIPAAVAPIVPTERRASAFGLFTAGYGIAWFLGSAAIGILYDRSVAAAVAFVLHAMGRLPQVGEAVETQGWRFEAVDLDSRRIDKVLAAPVRPETVLATRRPGAGPDPRTEVPPSRIPPWGRLDRGTC
jgi:MFS family permease